MKLVADKFVKKGMCRFWDNNIMITSGWKKALNNGWGTRIRT